ncbi:unnamed protein product [Fraxinus pennsylvanica]|uniref:Uncharacterized protein n=1 Tax=Fraxinus pennsylvanica TaxID=56036 RepID=A0AAD2ABB1_9LAMI|nr:unnamed protein product [Fraxinus pennsylvanica]
MKALSKPISSPIKGEKFPPPLMMRFLRSNVGSRSRGRLRTTPMFYLRSKKNGTETTQEPSSPKVTCIGQVRVRRISSRLHKPRPEVFRWFFRKWGLFFCTGYCKKADTKEDSFRVDLNQKTQMNQSHVGSSRNSIESENLGARVQENKEDFLEASSPPKNALLLIRCKSEPARTGERLNPEHNFWKQRGLGNNS